MSLSIVIRSRDEADRLRLVLASLTGQTGLTEVVVVDDGSTDHTPAVLAEAAGASRLRPRASWSAWRWRRPSGWHGRASTARSSTCAASLLSISKPSPGRLGARARW